MKLIVGLGNPGDKYLYTRHNIGFMVVEKFIKDLLPLIPSLHAWKKDKKINALVCRLHDCIVVKPQIFMNKSGMAVNMALKYYKIEAPDLWIVHDDIDLPVGKIRVRLGGSSGGHNGVESIINEIKTPNFVRFRLGIGRGKLSLKNSTGYNLHRREIEKYVLSPFFVNEAGEVKKLIKRTNEALKISLKEDYEVVMNRFN